jgi:hypothetical protein
MIEMTPAARERLDNYLQRMRSELRGSRSVVADDVEQSVREHIEIELAYATGPIGAAEVIGVLDRLGPPERWLADEDRSTWHGSTEGGAATADWRWAYLVFGLFVASLLLFQLIGPLLILPAMVASRAYVELARDRGEKLGARGWLVYPAIALVLAFAVFLLIVGPPLGLLESATSNLAAMFDVPPTDAGSPPFTLSAGGVIFGAWWIIAAAFCAAFLRPIRYTFAPLLDGLRRKHFAVLAGIGALVMVAGATLINLRY